MLSNLKRKDLTIITIIFIITTILCYELLYCNANYFNGISDTYTFSSYRIIMYLFIFIMFFLFKNRFIDVAIETFENKVKRNAVYTTLIISVIILAILIYLMLNRQIIYQLFGVIVITISLVNIFVIYINNDYTKNCIIICLTIGIIFSIVIPLNHILDEKRHFLSAYNLSYGNIDFKKPLINDSVYSLPRSRKYIVTTELFELPHIENFTYEYKDPNVDINDTPAPYSPLLYIAPACGIFVSRIMGGSIGDIFITGRIFGLLAYTAMSIGVLKLLPYKKKTFYVVLQLPLLIALSATYSADGTTMIVVSLFVIYILRLYEQKEEITLKQILIILLLFVLLLVVKVMAYIGVALLLLLILPKLFKQNKKLLSLLIVSIIIIALGVLALYSVRYSTEIDDPRGENVDSKAQIAYILENPKDFLILQINHIKKFISNYGAIDDINHPALFRQEATNVFFFIMLLMLYVSITDDTKTFDKKIKILFIIIYIIITVTIGTMMYISYTGVAETEIAGFQTRYLIPVLPLVLMCVYNKRIKYVGNRNEIFNITILMGIFCILSIVRTILLIS